MEEIVSMVFEEFKETMHLVWKTILENFEIVNFPNLVESTEDVSHHLNLEEENLHNLPPMIKIYFNSYNQQKLKQINNEVVMPMKKKNWLKRIYIFMKKLKINKN